MCSEPELLAAEQLAAAAQTEQPLLAGDAGALVTRAATPFLDRKPGVTRGREGQGGVRGSGWEDVEVAGPLPLFSSSASSCCTEKRQSRQRPWLIDYTVCTLIGPHVIAVTARPHEVGQRGVSGGGLFFIVATVSTSHLVVEAEHQKGKQCSTFTVSAAAKHAEPAHLSELQRIQVCPF